MQCTAPEEEEEDAEELVGVVAVAPDRRLAENAHVDEDRDAVDVDVDRTGQDRIG